MVGTNAERLAALNDLIERCSVELTFAQPGKDTGLLPVNSFLIQAEEILAEPTLPEEVRAGIRQARAWIDALLDTTVAFDEPTLAKFRGWQVWITAAVQAVEAGTPVPGVPSDWTPPTSMAAGESAGNVTDNPIAKTAVAASVAAGAVPELEEPVLILNLGSDGELLREFINESFEHLQNVEQGVLILEDHPTDADTLNSIFRAFHTFKGGSGFLSLTAIKDLAHELESLLDAARRQTLAIDSTIINIILEGGDTLRQFVNAIQNQLGGQEAGQPICVPTRKLISRVRAALQPGATPAPPPAPEAAATPATATASPVPVGPGTVAPRPGSTNGAAPKTGDAASAAAASAGFVKVGTLKLDSLIDLVGELVIAQSMLLQDPDVKAIQSQQLTRSVSQLRRITNDLQRTAMSLRMVPIRATFQKMTRLVRDLAAQQQKQIQLQFSGEETELDRTIVEVIADPFVHMIRNAADHGIEIPADRVAAGKPALGTIHLRASHQGGGIVIQIQDDGRGLNKDKLRAKAVERGLVRPDENLATEEIYNLIFAPGFSTAEKISDISGRGVGMDVVRRNIEKLRGKIDITSELGKGSTFTIFLPLTLAIIDGTIVSVSGERFILPTLSIRESFRPRADMIASVHGRGEMVQLRGRLSPLLRLYEYFNLPPKVTDPAQSIVVALESGSQTRCLMVDELLGKQEVVIKGLGDAVKKHRAVAGGAILGDGRVGLILDADALVRLNGSSTLRNSRSDAPDAPGVGATTATAKEVAA